MVLELIAIGQRVIQAAIELKQQSGLTDEQLLAAAETGDAATRDQAKKFLASLG